MPRIRSHREIGERYPVLRLLSTICHVVGITLLVFSGFLFVAGIVVFFAGMQQEIRGVVFVGMGIAWSIGLFVAGIQSLAMGSFFRLAIHVEENTRAAAQALERLQSNVDLKPEVDPRSIYLS